MGFRENFMNVKNTKFDNDSGDDVNKPRGMLMAYSTLVLLFWFFSADLRSFSFLGNAISFKDNVNHLWLVIFFVNIYFIIRFYSRIPNGSFRFDSGMHEVYDGVLISFVKTFYRRRFYKEFHAWQSHISKAESANGFYSRMRLSFSVLCHDKLEIENSKNADVKTLIHELPHELRNNLKPVMTYGGREIGESKSQRFSPWPAHTYLREFFPPVYFVRIVLVVTIFRGFMVRPWLTDLIFPLALGGFSACVALVMWVYVNWLNPAPTFCWI